MDHTARRIHPHALLTYDTAIDTDPAGVDELLTCATAPDPRRGEDLLQADTFVGHYSPAATESMTASSSARSGR